MKMQSLYFTKNNNAQKMADKISREQKCKCDQIPPAYPCEREMLVFISMESGRPSKQLIDFCKSFNLQRAKNVAFAVAGPDDKGVAELTEIVKATGVNVVPNVFHAKVKGGLFGGGKISDEDLANVVKWSNDVMQSVASAD